MNVSWAKVFHGDLTAEDAEERMGVLMRAPVSDAAMDALMPRVFAIAVARMVTVYDGLYVALAEERGIPLVTAGERLVGRVSGDAGLAKLMAWVGAVAA